MNREAVIATTRRLAARMNARFVPHPDQPFFVDTPSRVLFVGEKPSVTAHGRGWTWESRQLAAKTLSEALETIGVPWDRCSFVNLFGDHPDNPEEPLLRRLVQIGIDAANGVPVVAMGMKVNNWLSLASIPHKLIRHPAARGALRRRDLYAQHLREALA